MPIAKLFPATWAMRTTGTILTAGPWSRGQHLVQEDGQFEFHIQIYPLKLFGRALRKLPCFGHGVEIWIFALFASLCIFLLV